VGHIDIKFTFFILYCENQIQNVFTNFHTPASFFTIVPSLMAEEDEEEEEEEKEEEVEEEK
jgi:hypothetical protein